MITRLYKTEMYALLYDGTIVMVDFRTDDDRLEKSKQEVYFRYRFFDRFKFKKKSSWVRMEHVIAFAKTKKELRKTWRNYKNERTN